MPQDILPMLREEERRLVAELNETPLFQKLESVRRLIGLYSTVAQTSAANQSRPATSIVKPSVAVKGKGAAILDAAESYLDTIGRRAQTGEIAAELIRRGLPPGNKNPNGATSAYLSGAKDRFDNVPGEGYGLVRWNKLSSPTGRPNGLHEEHHDSPQQGESGGVAPPVPA